MGVHGVISGQSVTVKAPETGSGNTNAFDMGVHARYAADPLAGTYLFSNAQVGIENGRMDRNVSIDDYTTRTHANWSGLAGSLAGGGGYRWKLNDSMSVGPMASLNYTVLSRGAITEDGSEGSRLQLASNTLNSLHSSLGMSGNWDRSLSSGAAIGTDLQLSWEHELLNPKVTQNASFVSDQNVSFSSNNQIMGRDALSLKAGVYYLPVKNIELGAGVASDLFRPGCDSLSGKLSATWRF